jgi:hypothetical protein
MPKSAPTNMNDSFCTSNDTQSGQLGGQMRDNFPWHGVGSFGKGGSPSYYMQSDPSHIEYALMARHTAVGKRCTYIFADDIYANEFRFEFPDKTLTEIQKSEINNRAREHFIDINAYHEGRRACGFDFEQGESLFVIYREGDGLVYLEKPVDVEKPEYYSFTTPAEWDKQILRVEAINASDYYINTISSFGSASNIRVMFWAPSEATTIQQQKSSFYSTYYVHPSRAIRWKSDDIDYDQYKGASKLKACFDVLQIITKIIHSTGNAVQRYAWGQPWIKLKGTQSDKAFTNFKTKMGNPLDLQYFITDATVEDIAMLGVQGSHMDLPGIMQMLGQLASTSMGIPKSILFGESVGMTRPGEVSDRQYFGSVNKEQNKQNRFWRKLIAIDPFMQSLWKEFGISHFEINWGLKQVMSMTEQVEYEMRKFTNAQTMMNFAVFAEVRNYLGMPSFSKRYETLPNGKALCMKMYGIEPEEFDEIIPNFGTIRQVTAQQQVETEEEQAASEALAGNNNAENVTRQKSGMTPGSPNNLAAKATKEGVRREMKNIREGAAEGGSDQEQQTISEIDYIKAQLAAKDQLLNDMLDQLRTLRKDYSLNQLSEKFGMSKNKWTDIFNALAEDKKK